MVDPIDYYGDDIEENDDANIGSDHDYYDDGHASFAEKDNDETHYSNKLLKPQNCRLLKEEDVRRCMEEDISDVCRVLSISKDEANILLRHFNWSVSKVNDVWFADESGVRERVGLLDNKQATGSQQNSLADDDSLSIICGICFHSFSVDEIFSAACGHPYCRECWSSYITTSINNDSLGCLSLRCPQTSCRAAVVWELIDSFASQDDKRKYSEFLVKSYIEENRNRKWCPGVGCDYALEFINGEGSYDVTCHCFSSFCWNCDEEGHRPLDCNTVKSWILKNSSESENMTYILAYCKPCPNCKRPIEKNEGCMHMVCKVCLHHFCWICLQSTSYHINCNKYSPLGPEVLQIQMAKQSLEKYTHCFERWDANRKSKVKALADFQKVKNEQFENLSVKQAMPETHLDFITKAWLQVVECRRILGWSYAYGYYMPDDETAKKRFFEYLQGEAEARLEKLHGSVETELQQFLNTNKLFNDFNEYRNRVVHLTSVTGNYFEKLVKHWRMVYLMSTRWLAAVRKVTKKMIAGFVIVVPMPILCLSRCLHKCAGAYHMSPPQ